MKIFHILGILIEKECLLLHQVKQLNKYYFMTTISFNFDFSQFENGKSLNNVASIIDNEACACGFSCRFTHDLISKTAFCSLVYDLDEEATSCSFGVVVELINVLFEKVHRTGLFCTIKDITIY